MHSAFHVESQLRIFQKGILSFIEYEYSMLFMSIVLAICIGSPFMSIHSEKKKNQHCLLASLALDA